jgi:hypothetical protein
MFSGCRYSSATCRPNKTPQPTHWQKYPDRTFVRKSFTKSLPPIWPILLCVYPESYRSAPKSWYPEFCAIAAYLVYLSSLLSRPSKTNPGTRVEPSLPFPSEPACSPPATPTPELLHRWTQKQRRKSPIPLLVEREPSATDWEFINNENQTHQTLTSYGNRNPKKTSLLHTKMRRSNKHLVTYESNYPAK